MTDKYFFTLTQWDYIARDTRAVGETCTLVASRLIHAARVVDDTICYDWKDSQSVYELFHSRYSLHKRVYNHKSAKAIEYVGVCHLICDLVLSGDGLSPRWS